MDFLESEEPIYEYYTIVDNNSLDTDAEQNPVIFLKFEESEDENDLNIPEKNEIDDLSELNIISTLDDEEIFIGNTPVKVKTISELPDQSTLDENIITPADAIIEYKETEDVELFDDEELEYQEINLEDGTCAIVWNSAINSSTDDNKQYLKRCKKYHCGYDGCNKFYSSAQHLTVHLRSHTGTRPYTCTIEGCDKAFSTGYSLKAHIRTHTGEKPYACTCCDKQFKTSGDLQKHIRTHTGEKPFRCPIEGCGRSFTTSNIRKVHIRSHTGERPYVCQKPNCGKAFASSTNFKNHMRIHSGEKPYVCNVEGCGKRFTEYSSLYKHNMVHRPSKPFKCNYCGQSCKQESTLKVHKQSIHNVIISEDGTEYLVKRDNIQDTDIILEFTDQNSTDFIDADALQLL